MFVGRVRAFTPPPAIFALSVTTSRTNWNLLDELGFTPSKAVVVNITFTGSPLVRSTATGTAAMNMNGLPSGSVINLNTASGNVQGRGGRGGDANSTGFAAGHAIKGPGTGVTLNITNVNGRIWGGGGGAGGGGSANDTTGGAEPDIGTAGGGGGGGGAGGGGAGTAGTSFHSTGGSATNGQNGDAGTTGAGGDPGDGGDGGTIGAPFNANGGDGGDGGDWGEAGSAGAFATGGTINQPGAAGGAAGKAIDHDGATVNFVSGGSAPNVLGAVSA